MASIYIFRDEEPTWGDWRTRYESGLNGADEWREQSYEDDKWRRPRLPEPRPLLFRLSSAGSVSSRPRVFISHRQGDEAYAERIAYLADKNGFEFWLDTVHMPPRAIESMSAISIALRIEMALLNCSHIVAAYTSKTAGSTWVPYEYGRVKEPVLHDTKCCTWIHATKVPEWVELNDKCRGDSPLSNWFAKEFSRWRSRYPACPNTKPAGYPIGPGTLLP